MRDRVLLRPELVQSAADELLASALLGEGWAEALERLAAAAGGGGATLMRFQIGHPTAVLSSTGWAEVDADLVAGRLPPSRCRFFPEHVFGHGFRADQDVWPNEELQRDPYYQEVLKPRGVFFHAKARLWCGRGERVTISLKRQMRLGPYDPADLAMLDLFVPQLRAAVAIARRVLDAEASGMVRVLHQRGDPVVELDAQGRVMRMHGGDPEHLGIVVRNRQLVAVDRLEQPPIDKAVASALRPPHRPLLAPITGERGERRFLRIVPVTGAARDVFLATAAIAVIIDPEQPGASSLSKPAVRDALGLTAREAEIAALLTEGLSLSEVASRLHLQIGTARNHLKSIFEKTGTSRQGELIALLCKLRS
jgi:DNA-binding CsgD family transcriptional regulator